MSQRAGRFLAFPERGGGDLNEAFCTGRRLGSSLNVERWTLTARRRRRSGILGRSPKEAHSHNRHHFGNQQAQVTPQNELSATTQSGHQPRCPN